MIIVEGKISAPDTSGRRCQLHRWRCATCGRFGAWLLRIEVATANGVGHAATHINTEEVSP